MQISVIILTYDKHHQYLKQAINSVTFENFLKLEVIVVNNSPDTPIQSDGTIKVINVEKELQVGAARNLGFQHSTGETVLFLDGDDWLMPNILDFMWYHHLKNPENIIYGGLIRGDNGVVHMPQPQYKGNDINLSPIKKGNRPYCCLIPRHQFEKVQGFDEELESWEDLDFEIKTYLAGIEDTLIPQVVYYYRWNDNGRRALMDEKASGYDEKLAKVVNDVIYNRYKGAKMGCSSCGKKVVTKEYTNTEVPKPQDNMEVWVEYIHPEETFRTVGSYSGQSYKFGQIERLRYRQVTLKEEFDPSRFIHYQDVLSLHGVIYRNYNRIKVFTKTIFNEPVVKEEILVPDPPEITLVEPNTEQIVESELEIITTELEVEPDIETKFDIESLIETLQNEGVIEKRGSWYIYGEFKAQGLSKFVELINENELVGELNEYL